MFLPQSATYTGLDRLREPLCAGAVEPRRHAARARRRCGGSGRLERPVGGLRAMPGRRAEGAPEVLGGAATGALK